MQVDLTVDEAMALVVLCLIAVEHLGDGDANPARRQEVSTGEICDSMSAIRKLTAAVET